jgi:micrococcal nuclease
MVRVVDGDTIVVKINSQEETVRLIGIDTPEVVDPRKPVQCFGKEASEKIKELIQGKSVILTPDPTQNDKDNYGRLLRYVYLEDSTFINKKMIEEGYAFEYTYSIPYKYQLELKESQRQAKTNKLGLWADNACPTNTLVPTKKPTSLPQSTAVPQKPSSSTNTNVAPADTSSPGGSWACDCSKACGVMSSCAEAQYQLNSCGCQARDGDKDGIACDSDCQ